MSDNRLHRFNLMLDRDDIALLDEHFPNQRSELIRGLVRKFLREKIEPTAIHVQPESHE